MTVRISVDKMLDIFEEGSMFNGLQNWLTYRISELSDEEIKAAMQAAERMHPVVKDINYSFNLKAIKKAMDEFTDINALYVIYVNTVLEYRKLWNALCAFCQDNN
jgi:Zn/Cd-binding protein ZinT